MAHFYGTLQGSRGEATRCGTKSSGVHVQAAAWGGCGEAAVFVRPAGTGAASGIPAEDRLHLNVAKWRGVGQEIVCYNGPVGGAFDVYAWRGPSVRWVKEKAEVSKAEATEYASHPDQMASVVVPAGCSFQGF